MESKCGVHLSVRFTDQKLVGAAFLGFTGQFFPAVELFYIWIVLKAFSPASMALDNAPVTLILRQNFDPPCPLGRFFGFFSANSSSVCRLQYASFISTYSQPE